MKTVRGMTSWEEAKHGESTLSSRERAHRDVMSGWEVLDLLVGRERHWSCKY